MAKKKKRSVFPVYAAAIAWAVYAGRNPMFELKHLILCALLSIGVFFVASLIWKPKLVEIPEPSRKRSLNRRRRRKRRRERGIRNWTHFCWRVSAASAR